MLLLDTTQVVQNGIDWLGILKDIVLPLGSLVTAIVSIIIAVSSLKSQKIHNQNSFKPIIQINLGDYENDIFVKIVNRGVGPGIVDEVKLLKSKNKYLIDLFKSPECNKWVWTTFNKRFEGTAISPGSEFTMLRMEDPTDREKNIIRKGLCQEIIYIAYHDIYDNKFDMQYPLEFFGRHFTEAEKE